MISSLQLNGLNLQYTGLKPLEDNDSPQGVSFQEEILPGLLPDNQVELSQLEELVAELSRESQDGSPSRLKDLVADINHIVTCLNQLSITTENPAPMERLHKIALINVSYFKYWDINHVKEKFFPRDPQKNFTVAEYLIERLGKANTRRRQLLKYYESSAIERKELANASKLATPTMEVDKVEPVEIERDEDRSSQTFSTTNEMRVYFPPLPVGNAAFEGDPFECPYCFKIVKVRNQQDWRYVGNCRYARNHYIMLNIFLGDMYSGTFNLMFAHSATAPVQVNYMPADVIGSIMSCRTTTESGIVLPAKGLFHQRKNFMII